MQYKNKELQKRVNKRKAQHALYKLYPIMAGFLVGLVFVVGLYITLLMLLYLLS
jgi:hypothetical protein